MRWRSINTDDTDAMEGVEEVVEEVVEGGGGQ